jgi:hypothetical protein
VSAASPRPWVHGDRGGHARLGRAAFERYRADVAALDGVIADAGLTEFQTSYRGRRAVALGEVVSSNYFAVLVVPAHVGRLPTPDDDRARNPVIALGYSYWTRAFNADPSIIGETLVVNGRPQTIAGVRRTGSLESLWEQRRIFMRRSDPDF